MSTGHTILASGGIAISTSITAGGDQQQHAEGMIIFASTSPGGSHAQPAARTLSSAIKASDTSGNDVEGVVVCTAVTAGGFENHVEGIVAATAVKPGGISGNRAEGVVVSTAITAGGIWQNHAESLVVQTSPGRADLRGATCGGALARQSVRR